MKRMKKIIGCLVGVLLTAEAWAGGTLTFGSHVFTQGDSLHIELLLNLSNRKVPSVRDWVYPQGSERHSPGRPQRSLPIP